MKRLRDSKLSSIKCASPHGIQARIVRPSPFLPEGIENMTPYWRDLACRRDMEEKFAGYSSPNVKLSMRPECVKARFLISKLLCSWLPGKVPPYSIHKAARSIPQTTSPGFPYTKFGVTKKSEALTFAIKDVKQAFQRIRSNTYTPPPCLAAARLALHLKPKNSPRLVWAYPIEVTIQEARYVEPLMDWLHDHPLFAWKYNWLDGYGSFLHNKIMGSTTRFGFDFSGFDASVSPSLIRWAFNLLADMLILTNEERIRYNVIVDYFINTPIYMYDSLRIKSKGIPSGSYFTQLVGSIINAYVMTSAMLAVYSYKGFPLRTFSKLSDVFSYICVLGDDSIINCPIGLTGCDKKYLIHHALIVHGMTIHPTKGFWETGFKRSSRIEFLGKNIQGPEDILVDEKLVLAQIIYGENGDICPGDVLTRIVGVAWMCGTSKKAYDVCRLCWDWVRSKYPGCKPSPWRRDMSDLFEFLLGLTLPDLFLPDRSELLKRYCKWRSG